MVEYGNQPFYFVEENDILFLEENMVFTYVKYKYIPTIQLFSTNLSRFKILN